MPPAHCSSPLVALWGNHRVDGSAAIRCEPPAWAGPSLDGHSLNKSTSLEIAEHMQHVGVQEHLTSRLVLEVQLSGVPLAVSVRDNLEHDLLATTGHGEPFPRTAG